MADTVRDIALGTDGDLSISAGDIVLISGAEAIVQAIRIRLQFFKGEWFIDLNAGIPWFQDVLVKNPDVNLLYSIFRKALLETPGVLAVNALSLSLDRGTRTLTVSYRVSTDTDELTSTEVL